MFTTYLWWDAVLTCFDLHPHTHNIWWSKCVCLCVCVSVRVSWLLERSKQFFASHWPLPCDELRARIRWAHCEVRTPELPSSETEWNPNKGGWPYPLRQQTDQPTKQASNQPTTTQATHSPTNQWQPACSFWVFHWFCVHSLSISSSSRLEWLRQHCGLSWEMRCNQFVMLMLNNHQNGGFSK